MLYPCACLARGYFDGFVYLEGREGHLPTPQKEAAVAELTDALGKSGFTVLTDYRGLTVTQMQDLRRQLREHDAELHVTKNTLVRLAAQANGLEGLDPALEGPTAIMFAYGEPVLPAKVLRDFVRDSRILELKLAVFEGEVITSERVEMLADLPSKDELLGKVVGSLASPMHGLVNVLAGPARSLVYALDARKRQLEESAA